MNFTDCGRYADKKLRVSYNLPPRAGNLWFKLGDVEGSNIIFKIATTQVGKKLFGVIALSNNNNNIIKL